eukprot:CAMPEP_0182435922 /NCGR_PEP_ID=MMETSP1167-20130531/78377_1 /TAXON_ID=2988 /ORGANISM="Mallomonas Sp, Strain CCMP3275" /LENGTH=179 /DNA_ID=CAMNT_0024627477 /DNA_START=950 /DNA_END=1489 /DNA_ORIENTATION=+
MNYYELRFNMETYQRGYLSSMAAVINLLTQSFLIGPSLSLFSNDDSLMMLTSLIVITVSALMEYFSPSLSFFLVFSVIPKEIASGLVSAASRGMFAHVVPTEDTGKVLGVQGVLLSGMGVIAPLYGSQILLVLGKVKTKAIVSAAHFALTAVLVSALCSSSSVLLRKAGLVAQAHPHTD